jgi:hypothetical protein
VILLAEAHIDAAFDIPPMHDELAESVGLTKIRARLFVGAEEGQCAAVRRDGEAGARHS